MFLQQDDGHPPTSLKASVDAGGFGGDFFEQPLVSLDGCTAGRGNLDERKPALVRGIQFEKAFNAPETLENAFGVVHAIDADAKQAGVNVQVVANGGHLFADTAVKFLGV